MGASLEEAEEEDDDAASVDSGAIEQQKEGCFQVIGTLKDPKAKKPEFVKEIIEVNYIYLVIHRQMIKTGI